MPSKKRTAKRQKSQEPLSSAFTTLMLLAIASFVIGVFSGKDVNRAYSFIIVALLLLLVAVLVQFKHSRKTK